MTSSADKAFTCTINILDKYVMVLRQFNTDSFPVTSVNNLSRFWNPATPFVTLSGAITHDPLEAYLPDHIHNQLQAEYNTELNGELHPRLSFVTQCRQHIKPQTKKSATMQTISTAKNFKINLQIHFFQMNFLEISLIETNGLYGITIVMACLNLQFFWIVGKMFGLIMIHYTLR